MISGFCISFLLMPFRYVLDPLLELCDECWLVLQLWLGVGITPQSMYCFFLLAVLV